jgi:hypothetical protein
MLMVAGIATASIMAIAIVVFASRSNHDDAPPTLPPTIAEIKPAVDEPTMATTPVEPAKPAPEQIQELPPVKPPPVIDKPAAPPTPIRPPVVRPRPMPPVPHAAVQPPPVETPRPPVETPKPPPTPIDTPSPDQKMAAEKQALTSLYQQVGSEIARLRKTKGDAAANDVNNAYRRIQIMTAYATSTSRADTIAKLNALHAQIAAAMQSGTPP